MCTGNILSANSYLIFAMVYPCVYREHQIALHCVENGIGLSLCIQGTQTKTAVNLQIVRFIPVYTGNTEAPDNLKSHQCGLSLCIQGTHAYPACTEERLRFIPVYTGNTFNCSKSFIALTGLSLCIQGTR